MKLLSKGWKAKHVAAGGGGMYFAMICINIDITVDVKKPYMEYKDTVKFSVNLEPFILQCYTTEVQELNRSTALEK